jgi:hypothetical protein
MNAPSDKRVRDIALGFSKTQRNANAQLHNGITNLHVMRPKSQAPGAEPCEIGTVVNPDAKSILQNYVLLGYFSDAFADERTWSERTLPGMLNFTCHPEILDLFVMLPTILSQLSSRIRVECLRR